MSQGGANPEMMKQIITLQSNFANNHVEESVDTLMNKLQAQGKKVKIVDDEENPAVVYKTDNKIKQELLQKEELLK